MKIAFCIPGNTFSGWFLQNCTRLIQDLPKEIEWKLFRQYHPIVFKVREKIVNDGIEGENSVTTLMSCILASVDGKYDKFSINSFINMMPAADSRFVRQLYSEISPDIDLKQEFVCSACDHSVEMEVPLTAEFFWPG